jgi:hypothetical protein
VLAGYPGGSSTRRSAHSWANRAVKRLRGHDGIFGSELAFTGQDADGKNIYVAGFDGHGQRRLTSGRLNLLPSWAPRGGGLLFTTYAHLNPDLYLVTMSGGRPRRISSRPGLNTAGVYSPDGRRIAVTLSRDGNSEIYILSAAGEVLTRLTDHPGVDCDPSWSPDGKQIAFVSDREGNPQIYVVASGGGSPQRVTGLGQYNTTPRWNPRRDVDELAFTGSDERGSLDVFVIDVRTRQVRRLTQSTGNCLEPTWAPTGGWWPSPRPVGSRSSKARPAGTGGCWSPVASRIRRGARWCREGATSGRFGVLVRCETGPEAPDDLEMRFAGGFPGGGDAGGAARVRRPGCSGRRRVHPQGRRRDASYRPGEGRRTVVQDGRGRR